MNSITRTLHSHPSWCAPCLCTPDRAEVNHHSTPLLLPLTDGTWELQLVCTDQYQYGPSGMGVTELRVTLIELACGDSVHLSPEQILVLTSALTEMYWRARRRGHPCGAREHGGVLSPQPILPVLDAVRAHLTEWGLTGVASLTINPERAVPRG